MNIENEQAPRVREGATLRLIAWNSPDLTRFVRLILRKYSVSHCINLAFSRFKKRLKMSTSQFAFLKHFLPFHS